MNKYTICFTTIYHGKRHTHCEEFKAYDAKMAESYFRSRHKESGIEIMSIEAH